MRYLAPLCVLVVSMILRPQPKPGTSQGVPRVKNMMAVQMTAMAINKIPTTPDTLMVSTAIINTAIETSAMITNAQAHCFEFKLLRLLVLR